LFFRFRQVFFGEAFLEPDAQHFLAIFEAAKFSLKLQGVKIGKKDW
jgi:hypothetical protein